MSSRIDELIKERMADMFPHMRLPASESPTFATKEGLLSWAQNIAEVCEAQLENNDYIERSICKAFPFRDICYENSPHELLMDKVGGRWAVNAFPQVTIGEKHLAALIATKMPDDVLNAVRSPWSAWLIEIPPRVLSMMGDNLQRLPVARILVGWDATEGWLVYPVSTDGMVNFIQQYDAADLAYDGPEKRSMADEDGVLLVEGSDRLVSRSLTAIGRAVLGVALEMNSRQNLYREPSGPAPKWSKRKMGAPPIKCRTYQLRANVTVDCREQVRDFILGKRSSAPSVQHIVRGHWKMQACGPNLSERKPIWIQPYWRGPEGAAIAVRSHALKDEKPPVEAQAI